MPRQITTGQAGAAFTTALQYDGTGARVLKRKFAGAVNDEDSPNCTDNTAACLVEQTLDIGELYEQVSQFEPGTCDQASALDAQADHACQASQRVHQFRIYAGGHQVAQVKRIEHAGVFDADQIFYLHSDRLGSTSAITDNDGVRIEQRKFTAFGSPTDANFSGTGTGVLSGFTGLEHDDGLGLVNMRGRLYDPHLARFISADPFVMQPLNPQGLNRYSYVQNRPLNFTDPSGFDDAPPPPPDPPVTQQVEPMIIVGNAPSAPSTPSYQPSDPGIQPGGGGFQGPQGPQGGETPTTISQSTAFPASPGAEWWSAGSNGSASSGSPSGNGSPGASSPGPGGAIGLFTSYYNWNQSTGFLLPYPGTSFVPQYTPTSYSVPVLSAAITALDSSKTSERVGAGVLGAVELGVLVLPGGAEADVLFGQASVARTFTTAEAGSTFKYAGYSIAEVAAGLRSGAIAASEIPVGVVNIDGLVVAVNNRSLAALVRAGFSPTTIIDSSGDASSVQKVLGRLAEMGGTPSPAIRIRGMGAGTSAIY